MEAALNAQLMEVAYRIREMREISGFTREEMARRTEVSPQDYASFEAGRVDFPFTFVHKCALAFGIGITDLLGGESPRLSSYAVTRKGEGTVAAREDGINIASLAPLFRDKIAEPYWVRCDYSEARQSQPIHLVTHAGQEFDLVLRGSLKVQVGAHAEVLNEGDSIYYNSATPHGMIAVGGQECVFLAVVLPGEAKGGVEQPHESIVKAFQPEELVCNRFVKPEEDEHGALKGVAFENAESFNFAFDIVDELAKKSPDKLALLHVDNDGAERRFSFADMSKASNRCANYFRSLGIKK